MVNQAHAEGNLVLPMELKGVSYRLPCGAFVITELIFASDAHAMVSYVQFTNNSQVIVTTSSAIIIHVYVYQSFPE